MPLPAVNDRDVEQLSRSDLILLVQKLSAALERSVEERTALRADAGKCFDRELSRLCKERDTAQSLIQRTRLELMARIQQHDGYVAKEFTSAPSPDDTAHTDACIPPDRESGASKLSVLQRAVTDAQLALANAALDYERSLASVCSEHAHSQAALEAQLASAITDARLAAIDASTTRSRLVEARHRVSALEAEVVVLRKELRQCNMALASIHANSLEILRDGITRRALLQLTTSDGSTTENKSGRMWPIGVLSRAIGFMAMVAQPHERRLLPAHLVRVARSPDQPASALQTVIDSALEPVTSKALVEGPQTLTVSDAGVTHSHSLADILHVFCDDDRDCTGAHEWCQTLLSWGEQDELRRQQKCLSAVLRPAPAVGPLSSNESPEVIRNKPFVSHVVSPQLNAPAALVSPPDRDASLAVRARRSSDGVSENKTAVIPEGSSRAWTSFVRLGLPWKNMNEGAVDTIPSGYPAAPSGVVVSVTVPPEDPLLQGRTTESQSALALNQTAPPAARLHSPIAPNTTEAISGPRSSAVSWVGAFSGLFSNRPLSSTQTSSAGAQYSDAKLLDTSSPSLRSDNKRPPSLECAGSLVRAGTPVASPIDGPSALIQAVAVGVHGAYPSSTSYRVRGSTSDSMGELFGDARPVDDTPGTPVLEHTASNPIAPVVKETSCSRQQARALQPRTTTLQTIFFNRRFAQRPVAQFRKRKFHSAPLCYRRSSLFSPIRMLYDPPFETANSFTAANQTGRFAMALNAVPLFSSLDLVEQDILRGMFALRRLCAGEQVLFEGGSTLYVCTVLEGAVRVLVRESYLTLPLQSSTVVAGNAFAFHRVPAKTEVISVVATCDSVIRSCSFASLRTTLRLFYRSRLLTNESFRSSGGASSTCSSNAGDLPVGTRLERLRAALSQGNSRSSVTSALRRWQHALVSLPLPRSPLGACDIDQAHRDLIREHSVVLNGEQFLLGSASHLQTLTEQLSKQLVTHVLHSTPENTTMVADIVKRTLIAASRTVSGGDSFAMLQEVLPFPANVFIAAEPSVQPPPDVRINSEHVLVRSVNLFRLCHSGDQPTAFQTRHESRQRSAVSLFGRSKHVRSDPITAKYPPYALRENDGIHIWALLRCVTTEVIDIGPNNDRSALLSVFITTCS